MLWKIYYADGETFSSKDGEWSDAPEYGVVCVVTLDPTDVWGRFVLHNHEYYYKIPGKEVMCSEGLEYVKAHVPNITPKQIKCGGNAWQEDWNKILTRATHDEDFPKKSPRRRVTDWPIGDPQRPNY